MLYSRRYGVLVKCRICGLQLKLKDGRELTEHLHDKHADKILEIATAFGSYISTFLFDVVDRTMRNVSDYSLHQRVMLNGFQTYVKGLEQQQPKKGKA
jgi:hypothetical protein